MNIQKDLVWPKATSNGLTAANYTKKLETTLEEIRSIEHKFPKCLVLRKVFGVWQVTWQAYDHSKNIINSATVWKGFTLARPRHICTEGWEAFRNLIEEEQERKAYQSEINS